MWLSKRCSPLLRAPYLDPFPFTDHSTTKGVFVSDTPDAVKHEHQQNIKLFCFASSLMICSLSVFRPYLVAETPSLLFLMDNHPAHLFAKGMTALFAAWECQPWFLSSRSTCLSVWKHGIMYKLDFFMVDPSFHIVNGPI